MPSGGHNKIRCKELDAIVIERYKAGVITTDIAAEIGVDPATIVTWRIDDPTFDAACSLAQERGYDIQADLLLKIPIEMPDIYRARLLSENMRWVLSKKAPHKYGDRMEHIVTGSLDLKAALTAGLGRALPRRDLIDIEDAEIVDTKQLNNECVTGSEAVIPSESLPDIFD